MNMKMILALAAVAVATVAGASTNYVEVATRNRNLCTTVRKMSQDPALADPAVFRATLEQVDREMATGAVAVPYQGVSRRCPQTARSVLASCERFSDRVRDDLLADCGYDAENTGLGLSAKEAGYANFVLQQTCGDAIPVATARNSVLNAAIIPARRAIRAEGGSFVGKDGAKRVKEKLDALAAELNAPGFGKAGELLAKLGMGVEWDFIQSRILDELKVSEIRTLLLDGEIPFTPTLQNKLCIALGVEGYNAFVREYNGESKK